MAGFLFLRVRFLLGVIPCKPHKTYIKIAGCLPRNYYNHPFGQELHGKPVFAVFDSEADGGVGKRRGKRRVKYKSS
jgi:hypothetical protein